MPSNSFDLSSPIMGSSLSQQVRGANEDPEDFARQQRFREKEEARLRELQKKQVEEIELKNERRSAAREKLLAMIKNLESLKSTKRNSRTQGDSPTGAAAGGSWGIIKSNIALKNGDFPGHKDVSRMRDAIVNKAKDTGVN